MHTSHNLARAFARPSRAYIITRDDDDDVRVFMKERVSRAITAAAASHFF